jgi:hypothetical protein
MEKKIEGTGFIAVADSGGDGILRTSSVDSTTQLFRTLPAFMSF